jgi:hypothetical protein
MAKAKKPQPDHINTVYYYASDVVLLGAGDEIYPESTQEEAISSLRHHNKDVETIYMYEIKCICKYKINFQLEKLD